MTAVTFGLDEAVFDGELKGELAQDPFGIGHYACGMLEAAVGACRVAAKALAEAEGNPAPAGYKVTLNAGKGVFSISFKVA